MGDYKNREASWLLRWLLILRKIYIGQRLKVKSQEYPSGNADQNCSEITWHLLEWSSSSTSGYLSQENENTNSERYMHPHIPCSIVYNGQDMEAA